MTQSQAPKALPADESESEGDEEGEPEMSKQDREAKATSLEHLLTHKPANDFCENCLRGKMRNLRKLRGAFKRELRAWGALITLDFMISRGEKDLGFLAEANCLSIKDIFSGLVGVYPSATRTSDDVFAAIRNFIKDRPFTQSYSDGVLRS